MLCAAEAQCTQLGLSRESKKAKSFLLNSIINIVIIVFIQKGIQIHVFVLVLKMQDAKKMLLLLLQM